MSIEFARLDPRLVLIVSVRSFAPAHADNRHPAGGFARCPALSTRGVIPAVGWRTVFG
ncbi:MAG TPA: hypothetical protein VG165_12085 [Solirubrobacteraceae bacterium]|nr:hypothetical protein [Solirubrobacteraceae bacterium]